MDSISTDYFRKFHPINMDFFLYLGRLRQLQSLSQEQIIDAIKSACDFFDREKTKTLMTTI